MKWGLGGLVVLVAICGAVLAQGGASAAAPLTKDEYALQATKIDGRAELIVSRRFYPLVDGDPPPRKQCARQIHLLAERLSGPLDSADRIEPPPEIASIHDQIVRAGRRVVRLIAKPATPVARGRIDCVVAAGRVEDRYFESPLPDLEQELYDRGYLLGGY